MRPGKLFLRKRLRSLGTRAFAISIKPTIREIAAATGVNVSTVSRVLSGQAARTRIPAATAERVQSAADRLGYRPNLLARGLKTKRTNTIGLIVTDLSNTFFASIAGAVEAEARAAGLTTIIAASGEDPRRESEYLQALRARPSDGLIVAPVPGNGLREMLKKMASEMFPLVLIDRDVRGIDCGRVLSESRNGARALVAELTQLGCRRIGFAAGPADVWTAAQRLAGYQDGLKDAKIPWDENLIRKGSYTEAHGREAAKYFLSMKTAKRPLEVDGIIAANNKILVGVLEVLAEAGQKARNLPVAGFDGVPLAAHLGRPLIIAEQPVGAMGRAAARMLIDRILNKGEAAKAKVKPKAMTLPVQIKRYGIKTAERF